jgi:soluble lytic murein transglycosylase-like protein
MREFESLFMSPFRPISLGVKLTLLMLVLLPAWGAEPADQAAAAQRQSVRAMEASVAKQRAAVARMRASLTYRRDEAPRLAAPLALVTPEFPAPASPGCQPLSEGQVSALVEEAGAREGLAAGLLRAVIEKESASYPCAVSKKGALGLMQLMPATITQLSVRDPFNPEESVSAGTKLLKQLLLRYEGDLALALGAYNAGPARVDAAGGVPAIQETVDYVRQILTRIPRMQDRPLF